MKLGRELRAAPREARAAISDITNPDLWLLHALFGGPTKSGANVNENTAFNVPTVRACIDIRSDLLAVLPLKVFRKTARGPEEQRDHPLARMFRGRVSPGMTSFKFRKTMQVSHDLGGNGYARVHRDAYFQPVRIVWKRPTEITPLENPATDEIGWRVLGQGDLAAHDILHVPNLSTNGRTGRSPLFDLRESVGLSLTAEEFTSRTFSNGNRKPGFFIPPLAWKKAQADDFAEQWAKHQSGAANAGKNAIIGGGMTWQDAGFSNQEAELLSVRKYSKEELAEVYRIPLVLVNSTEKSTSGYGANVDQVMQGLMDFTMYPIYANWEAELNTTLLTEREQEEGYYFKFMIDALLRGNPTVRAAFYEKMRGLRAMTVTEIREREEMPEAPDLGANNLDWPLNNQGGGGTPAAQPDPALNQN
ncbi:MAG: phage portal protein [Sphingomonadales bacterium]|nr:phage portal protein [Sphingomonadales bacterium]